MQMRLDALLAILTYSNGTNPLYLVPSLSGANSYWINESPSEVHTNAQTCHYEMDTNTVCRITRDWEKLLLEFKDKVGDDYHHFKKEMGEFVRRVPEELWFFGQSRQEKKTKQIILPPYHNEDDRNMGLSDSQWEEYFNSKGAV